MNLRLKTVSQPRKIMSVYRKQLSVSLTMTLSCDPFIILKIEMKYPAMWRLHFSAFFFLQEKCSILKVSFSKAYRFTETLSKDRCPPADLSDILIQLHFFLHKSSCILLYFKIIKVGERKWSRVITLLSVKMVYVFLVNDRIINRHCKYSFKYETHLQSPLELENQKKKKSKHDSCPLSSEIKQFQPIILCPWNLANDLP